MMDEHFYHEGMQVWVKNPLQTSSKIPLSKIDESEKDSVYWKGKIVEVKPNGNVSIVFEPNTRECIWVKLSELSPANTVDDIDDLVDLGHLNDATLLQSVRARFRKSKQQQIYTWAGPILIAVNPYKIVLDRNGKSIYDSAYVQKYQHAMQTEKRDTGVPHIYAVAANAISTFIATQENQSIVISGESGAGKTESTKQIMQFIAKCSKNTNDESGIESKLLQSNPVLEAFGNAKTLRNDNSSRFGKFIQILIHNQGQRISISGGIVKDFLLEKSRVTHHVSGERTYHVFYRLLAGASAALLDEFSLSTKEQYRYLNPEVQEKLLNTISKSTTSTSSKPRNPSYITEIDDKEGFKELVHSLKVVGIDEATKHTIFRLLAGILHLGNIDLIGSADTSSIKNGETNASLQIAARLLGLQTAQLAKDITVKETTTGGSTIVSPLGVARAYHGVDALAKAIYGRLFNWIVQEINKLVHSTYKTPESYIGILDIFGFEVFEKNGFEQFCINFANEKLHQLFTTYVFKLELELYERERIDYSSITFEDNSKIIEVIEKRPAGLFSLLDEACLFPKSTDVSFVNKANTVLGSKPDTAYSSGTVKQLKYGVGFVINHSASPVIYTAADFLEKNRDKLESNILRLISQSSIPLLKELFQDTNASGSITGSNAFLGSKFKDDINKLMLTLQGTTPHFVRCLKANADKRPGFMDDGLVMHQLRYLGVLDSIRIRQAGFSYRTPYREFYSRFALIVPSLPSPVKLVASGSNEEIIRHTKTLVGELWKMIQSIQNKRSSSNMNNLGEVFQCGVTRVFLRKQMIQSLESLREMKLKAMIQASIKVQSFFRMLHVRQMLRTIQKGLEQVRSAWRSKRDRAAYALDMKRARVARRYAAKWIAYHRSAKRQRLAIKIQAVFRSHIVRKHANRVYQGVQKFQALYRRHAEQRARERRRKSVILLQSCARSFLVRHRIFLHKVQCASRVQSVLRGYLFRKKHSREMEFLADKRFERFRIKCVTKIAATYHMFVMRQRYMFLKYNAKIVQYWYQGFLMRARFLRIQQANAYAQRIVRGFLGRSKVRRILTQQLLDKQNWRMNQLRCRENQSILRSARHEDWIQGKLSASETIRINYKKTVIDTQAQEAVHKTIEVDVLANVSEVYPLSWVQAVAKMDVACVATGSEHSVALLNDGNLMSWGFNHMGQLGHGTLEASTQPQIIQFFAKPSQDFGMRIIVSAIATGEHHSLAMCRDGNLYSWGSNEIGQLGLGKDAPVCVSMPNRIPNIRKAKMIAAGASFCAAICGVGTLYTWGGPGEVLGLGVYANLGNVCEPSIVKGLEKEIVASVACGRDFAVACSRAGHVYTFGNNSYMQLGLGDTKSRLVPVRVPLPKACSFVACGGRHAVAISNQHHLYAWGWNKFGQLGTGHFDTLGTPVRVDVPLVKFAVCGWRSTMVLTQKNSLYLWGAIAHGLSDEEKFGPATETSCAEFSHFISTPQSFSLNLQGRVPLRLVSTKGFALSYLGLVYKQKPATMAMLTIPLFGSASSLFTNRVEVPKLLIDENGNAVNIEYMDRKELEALIGRLMDGEEAKFYLDESYSYSLPVERITMPGDLEYRVDRIPIEEEGSMSMPLSIDDLRTDETTSPMAVPRPKSPTFKDSFVMELMHSKSPKKTAKKSTKPEPEKGETIKKEESSIEKKSVSPARQRPVIASTIAKIVSRPVLQRSGSGSISQQDLMLTESMILKRVGSQQTEWKTDGLKEFATKLKHQAINDFETIWDRHSPKKS